MVVAGLKHHSAIPRHPVIEAGRCEDVLLNAQGGRPLVSGARIAMSLTFFGFTFGCAPAGGAGNKQESISSVLFGGARA